MKRAAVFFADGFEDVEAISPVDYLRRAGVEVTTVAVPSSTMKDKKIVTSSHNVSMIMDTTLEEYLADVAKNLPDCVVCPGGSVGADNLSESPELLEHLEKCFDSGKIVSALCASPAVVLGKTKVLDGRKWTCYPGMQTEGNELYLDKYMNEVFVTDGNVVTGRGPGASEQFSMELVRILVGEETAKKIHDGAQQR